MIIRSQLYVALDAGHISNEQFSQLNARASEVSRILGGLRASLRKKD